MPQYMHQFDDGDPIVIVFRGKSGELHDRVAHYHDPPILWDDAGTTWLHFYDYVPDNVTDVLQLASVVEIRSRGIAP